MQSDINTDYAHDLGKKVVTQIGAAKQNLEKIDTTLIQLEEWTNLIYNNERSFFSSLFQHDDVMLLDVYFNTGAVNCTFLVPSGATWANSKPMEEFLKWVSQF